MLLAAMDKMLQICDWHDKLRHLLGLFHDFEAFALSIDWVIFVVVYVDCCTENYSLRSYEAFVIVVDCITDFAG